MTDQTNPDLPEKKPEQTKKPHETFKEKLDEALDELGNAVGEAKFGE